MSDGFSEYLQEMFAPLGEVSMRRMFGGVGVYGDGLMFALVADDVLYFKADQETIPLFEAEGCVPFGFTTKNGRSTLTSYWRAPERLYDEPDAFLEFAKAATAAARRADARKKPARSAGRKGRKRGDEPGT